jgi:hypothetical protein
MALLPHLSPKAQEAIAPLIVDGTDWKNSEQISSMLKKIAGPELYDDGKEMSPESMAQMIYQLKEQAKQLQGQNEELKSVVLSGIETEKERTSRALQVESMKSKTTIDKTMLTNSNSVKTTGMGNQNSLEVQEMRNQGAINQILAKNMADIASNMERLNTSMDSLVIKQ